MFKSLKVLNELICRVLLELELNTDLFHVQGMCKL